MELTHALAHELGHWIGAYGYLAVALGTFLEGETVLLLAGYAAHQGYLDLPAVIVVAGISSLAGDQLYFAIGRWRGDALIRRFPGLQAPWKHVQSRICRHQDLLILSVRFLYGLRIAGPVLIGMSGVAWSRFLLFNLLGALLWAPLIAGLGYLAGHALEALMGDVQRGEAWVFLVLLLVGMAWHVAGRLKAAVKRRNQAGVSRADGVHRMPR